MARIVFFLLRLSFKIALVLIALGCFGFALMQTKWAKETLRSSLVELLAAQGINAHIERLEGRLPFTWTIDEMQIQDPSGYKASLLHTKIRLKVLPLLRQRIAIDYLHIETVDLVLSSSASVETWTLDTLKNTLRSLTPARHLSIHHLRIDQLYCAQINCAVSIDAKGRWRQDNREFSLHLQVSPLDTTQIHAEAFLQGNHLHNTISIGIKARLEEQGSVEASLSGPWNTWQALIWEDVPSEEPLQGKLKGRFDALQWPQPLAMLPTAWKWSSTLRIEPQGQLQLSGDVLSLSQAKIQGNFNARYENGEWKGGIALGTAAGPLPFFGNVHCLWLPGKLLELSEIALSSEEATLHGEVLIDLQTHLAQGILYAQTTTIETFAPLIGIDSLRGAVGLECTLDPLELSQHIHLHLFSQHLAYKEIRAEQLSLLADIYHLTDTPFGTIELTTSQISTPHMFLETIALQTTRTSEKQWDFTLTATGELDDPLALTAEGNWELEDHALALTLTQAHGQIAQHPFFLQQPCTALFAPNRWSLTQSAWSVGDGSITTSATFTEDAALAQVQMTHFPLSPLKLFYPSIAMNGTTTASGMIEATPTNISGNFNAVLEQTHLLYHHKETPLLTKGSLQLHLDHQLLQVHTLLTSTDGQFLDGTASLPIIYTVFPFSLALHPTERLSGEITAEGKIEEIFDFINIGPHQITGLISTRLLLSQTLKNPALHGMIDWQKGSYENYYTGTDLKEIDVHVEAENNLLKLIHLTALGEKGSITAEGTLEINAAKQFPYAISAELTNINAVHFDLIDAHLTGPLYITGTTASALAQGNLLVSEGTIKIPDQLPYEIPNLPITFIHRPAHLASSQVISTPSFPVHLDLELSTDEYIRVEGKGLSSECKGSVRLTGTNLSIGAEGTLHLTQGEYLFMGKSFKLTEGQIVFNNKPTPSAYLTLKGLLNLHDAEIIAQLHGPLTSPQLTFHSNPHLSTSAILSRILFNKDISDISQTEAIQLATALIDLSGGATPGVMEAIRKTLGVDRFTISPSDTNEIALQIGKYLTKGVLVTLSQSATSTQVIVEVELKQGFVFQAQTQEEQEGKFSLKWRRNY